jgi:hypothetical protein
MIGSFPVLAGDSNGTIFQKEITTQYTRAKNNKKMLSLALLASFCPNILNNQ